MLIDFNSGLLPKKFILMVSAGMDSVAICHFLSEIKHKQFIVGHFNHKVIPEDEEMQEKVLALCKHLDLSCLTENNQNPIDEKDGGMEAACRRERLAFYNSLNEHVVVCHHLDDCVESYFMNFLKGCPERLPIPMKTSLDNGKFIYRPFLKSTKQGFRQWIYRFNLNEFIVEDPMNKDISRMRNWTRHRMLPEIEKFYPGLRTVVRKKVLQSESHNVK